jgi:hypothetical protein
VTNAIYADVKTRLERNLVERENAATNNAAISTNLVIAPTNAPVSSK